MVFNNKVYNFLKWTALICLPALSTLVMAVGDIWAIPCKEQIALTIAAVDTFIGVMLGISTSTYKGEGTIAVDEHSDECVILFNEEDTLDKAKKEGRITLGVETVQDMEAVSQEKTDVA